jgi:A/G-specific adenine glycosylase
VDKRRVRRIQARLLGWYEENQRSLPWRQTQDPYRVWVSEVMLQQTQVDTVIPYYRRFLKRFPTVRRLASAELEEVLKLWEGLGYYARCRNLHRAAKVVVDCHQGRLPSDQRELERLPGVGGYISAAVLSIAFDQPYAVVDGNVKRVLARMLRIDRPANTSASTRVFQAAAEGLLDRARPGWFNQALMELGALVCTPKAPDCRRCPLRPSCEAYRTGQVDAFPKRQRRRPVPHHAISVGVVFRNSRVLITRRKPEGLLGGLWEFPGGKVEKDESPEEACIREIKEEVNLDVSVDTYLTQVRHAYSHFRITMDVFRCRYRKGRVKLNGPVDFRWIKPEEIEAYPFHQANRKFIPLLVPGKE